VAVYNHYKRIYHNLLHSVITSPTVAHDIENSATAASTDVRNNTDILHKLTSSLVPPGLAAKGDELASYSV